MKKLKRCSLILVIVGALMGYPLRADVGIDPEPKESLFSNTDIFIFLDGYYAKSDVNFLDNQRPFVTQALYSDQFSINHALVNIEAENESVRFALGVHTGTYVQSNYADEPEQLQYIYQGWMGFSILDNLWLDIGVFPSHIGGESTLSFDNFNYTRSIVAENSPYFETGARLVWELNSRFNARLYILNGWQQINNQNRDLAAGLQLEYVLWDNWTMNFSNFIGNEAPTDESRQIRYFHNFYIKGKIYDWLETYLIYDLGFQRKNSTSWVNGLNDYRVWTSSNDRNGFHRWEGFSIQFYIHLTDRWKLGLRGEGYYDPHEKIVRTDTRNGYQLESGSINVDYLPISYVMARLEVKTNSAIDPIYRNENNQQFTRENLAVFSISVKYDLK